MAVIIFVVAHWYVSLFFQTFFHHRFAAHAMYSISKGWQRVFVWLSFIAQGSAYLSPYVYGLLHRLHHAHADTEKDPHSPLYDSNLFSMMWRTKIIYSAIYAKKYDVDPKYFRMMAEHFPEEKLFDKWFIRVLWMGVYVWIYTMIATAWWQYLFLPIHFFSGPIHGAVINWFAHKYGYVNFKVNDTSKNILPVDILMLGEGYHNNHHKYGNRPNFGVKWHEFDPIYPFILLFNAIGIIKLRKNAPEF